MKHCPWLFVHSYPQLRLRGRCFLSTLSSQTEGMGTAKYVPTTSDGTFNTAFKAIASELDGFNELRERLVKASRDTTYQSKKAIFALHRVKDSNRAEILEQGVKNLTAIRELIATRIASEMSADLYPRLHRSFSPGMQEYVEAAIFHAYIRDGALISRDALSAEVADACAQNNPDGFKMYVEAGDYVLGVADATGELMRLAIAAGGQGNARVCFAVRDFLVMMVESFDGLKLPGYAGRDLSFKMNVMRQSCEKVEATCFGLSMRRAEFGENALPVDAAVAAATADLEGAEGIRGNGAGRGGRGGGGRRGDRESRNDRGGAGADDGGPSARKRMRAE